MSSRTRLRKRSRQSAAAPRARLDTIVWLASYPKSGNTWTRIFLANYLLNPPEPVPINEVRRFSVGDSAVDLYEKVATGPFDPTDPATFLGLRDRVLRKVAGNGADMNFVKTHNRNDRVLGVGLIDRRYTRAAIYILRHPLDVAISYARHFGMTPARACASISRSDNTTAGVEHNAKQFLGSWSEHAASWTGVRDFPVHVMRYEDMRADPHAAFGAMLGTLGIPVDAERLDRAIRFSSFDELRRQEARDGFVEASRKSERFFHSGSSGQWQGVLTAEDIATVRNANYATMLEHGYL